MGKRVEKKSGTGSFIALCVYAVVLTAALLALLVIFAREPDLAPPGICKTIALAVPAVTLIVVIVALFQRLSETKQGKRG